GISGDMFLGALLDVGVSARVFEEAVSALGVGAKLEISRVNRSGISATKVDVIVRGQKDSPRVSLDRQTSGRTETSDSSTSSGQAPHGHSHKHEHQHRRGLPQIREIIRGAALTDSSKNTAISIFEKLGEAEAKIHDVPVEKIHFHEIGALDALVDIVCAAVGVEALGVD